MKKHVIEFGRRGMMAAWGGPAILAAVYFALGRAGVIQTLTPAEVFKGILTVTLLAECTEQIARTVEREGKTGYVRGGGTAQ